MVKIYKTNNSGKNRLKGRWNEFHKEDFERHNLKEYFYKPIESIQLEQLYDKLIAIMKKENFAFYEEIEVKPFTKFGKLHEVWINFSHID